MQLLINIEQTPLSLLQKSNELQAGERGKKRPVALEQTTLSKKFSQLNCLCGRHIDDCFKLTNKTAEEYIYIHFDCIFGRLLNN